MARERKKKGEAVDPVDSTASEASDDAAVQERSGEVTVEDLETAETSAEEASAPEGGGEVTLAEMEEDLQGVLEELEDLRDRHLRLAAEFENYRKRTRREHAELTNTAQAALIRRLLPTLDDLARVASTPRETTTVEAIEQGVELILKNLRRELEEAGLKRVEAQDARFDPEQHEAVLSTETDDPELDGTIARVFQDGYEFRGRLVRPAQVEVRTYTGPEAEAAAEGNEERGEA